MKLKTKLIATIVSMCAAIAVMAVGVWASTSQNFTVTIKNDVDVKIINVNADVYGEFAVYTQFTGSEAGEGKATKTPKYAQRYTTTALDTTVGDTQQHAGHVNKDHGYLLYAQGIGGYNDGADGTFNGEYDYEKVVGTPDGQVLTDSGYGKFIEESKDFVFLATSNATLPNTNETTQGRTDNNYYKLNYNVDSTTRTAQVAYMYTIRQWKMAAELAATNEMYLTVSAGNASNLTTKLNNMGTALDADVVPHIYISNPTGTNATVWTELTSGTMYQLPKNWNTDQTYYVLVTFTFARNGANLDLSLLSDALQHRVLLEAETTATGVPVVTNLLGSNGVTIYSANGRVEGTNFDVQGVAYMPTWANQRTDSATTATYYPKVDSTYTSTELARCFATKTITNGTDVAETHLPDGFIYVGDSASSSALGSDYTWVKTLNDGGTLTVTANSHTSMDLA